MGAALATVGLEPSHSLLSAQSGSTLNGHQVRLEQGGKLLAWPPAQTDAYDQVLGLSTNFLLTGVPNANNGLKLYYTYSYADPGTPLQPVGWPHNPAGVFAMLTDSGLGYYAYSGQSGMANLVRDVLTYHLDHGMTPATWNWPSVPYASSAIRPQRPIGGELGQQHGRRRRCWRDPAGQGW